MILSANSIKKRNLIYPCVPRTRIFGMTYGLSAAGYDVRVAQDIILSPDSFELASTMEQFQMDKDVVGIVHDKSTWARRGMAVQNTVIEPGWRGYLTLELTNHSTDIILIREGMPIAQILFHLTDEPTEGYEGKYQDQEAGAQPARYDES